MITDVIDSAGVIRKFSHEHLQNAFIIKFFAQLNTVSNTAKHFLNKNTFCNNTAHGSMKLPMKNKLSASHKLAVKVYA